MLTVDQMREALERHITQNRAGLEVCFGQADKEMAAEPGTKVETMLRAGRQDTLYPVMDRLQGMQFVFRMPVAVRDDEGNLIISRDASTGKVDFTVVTGSTGVIHCPDLKGTCMTTRFGYHGCQDKCLSSRFV